MACNQNTLHILVLLLTVCVTGHSLQCFLCCYEMFLQTQQSGVRVKLPSNLSQNGQKSIPLALMTSSTKNPKPKNFFHCKLEDS